MTITIKENPIQLFQEWFDIAKNDKTISDPTAMFLATASPAAIPSLRAVLLKKFDERGFIFYTNFESRKGQELLANPVAALAFYWPSLGKQIRIEGKTEIVSDSEADAYYHSREWKSRIGAWASKQSRPMKGRYELERRIAKYMLFFNVRKISRPKYWSGFIVKPERIEFWQDGAFRLHERVLYTKIDGKWTTSFLFP